MLIHSQASSFAGLPVFLYGPDDEEKPDDPATVAWRLEVEDFEAEPAEFEQLVEAFLAEIPAEAVRALVIGEWGSAYERELPVELLAAAASRLPGLRGLFLADLVSEQCEISWINHTDITPLLAAGPGLELLHVRGGQGLRLDPVRHTGLREVVFESGGLPAELVRGVGGSDLPAVESLSLWLGRSDYSGDATPDDLAGVLGGAGLPSVRHLALCNAEIADGVAAAVAGAAVVPRLTTLDLSRGVLTDAGADALLAGQPLTHLRRLDLHHHYLSDEAQHRLTAALPGVEVDLSDRQEAEEYHGRVYRYTAVGE